MAQYPTVTVADSYFGDHWNASIWFKKDTDDKNKALIHATRLVDALNYKGVKNDSAQTLEFPRGSDTTVPDDIIHATCEVALALVDGRNLETEHFNMSRTSANVAGVHVRHDPEILNVAFLHNIPSMVAWSLLMPYLRDRRVFRFDRVD